MDQLNSEYRDLIKRKEDLESEIKSLNEILACNSDVGMKENLVDPEGYPRSDIDVYSVRHARHKIICLQNDHKEIMKDVEGKLYQIHDLARQTKTVSSGKDAATVSHQPQYPGFLVVNQVAPGGPAAQAGLKEGDVIKVFGSVSKVNFKSLQDVGAVVNHSKDSVVKLVIERAGKEHKLELVPRAWSGRGLLGCNVVEVNK